MDNKVGGRATNGIGPLSETCLLAEIDLLAFADKPDDD